MSGSRTAAVAIPFVAVFLVAFLAADAAARFGDGRLEVSWRNAGSLRTGLSRLAPDTPLRRENPIDLERTELVLLAPFGERRVALVPTGSAADPVTIEPNLFSTRFDEVDPGGARLEVRHGDEVLASWDIFVRAELTTRISIDLNRGELAVDAVHPDPFGNWESWSGTELRLLPGRGEDSMDGIDTAEDRAATPYLDGRRIERPTRLGEQHVRLERGLSGAQTPLSIVPPAFGSDGRWLFSRPTPGRYGAAHGSFDTAIRGSGSAVGAWQTERDGWGTIDLSGQLSWRAYDDAGPVSLEESLDHNSLEALEASLRATLEPRERDRLHLHFYARGNTRDYYEHEFAENLDHAAREDRAQLLLASTYETQLARTEASLDLQFGRAYLETGDGADFDVFSNYSRLEFLPETVPNGLYWIGDDPETAVDEGHLRDYYLRTVTNEWKIRLDTETDWDLVGGQPLRAGGQIRLVTWRSYEHLAPSAVANGFGGGYQLTSVHGYTFDGDETGSEQGREAKTPVELALYGSQRADLGRASLEGGLRWSYFAPGQSGVRSLTDVLGENETLGAEDLGEEPTWNRLEPRIGFYTPVGSRTHLWLDGGASHRLPPFEALYYDMQFLELQAGVASETELRAAADRAFGNPELEPERTWSAHLGLVHHLAENFTLRAAGRLSRTSDTWVVVRRSVGVDSLAFYDNEGERRERNLHLGVHWRTGRHSRIRASYDLGNIESNVIEPLPLLRGLRYPSLPLESPGNPQVTVTDPSWFHGGGEGEFHPSLVDRRHRLSVALFTRFNDPAPDDPAGRRGGNLVLTFRAASGLPYTPTFVRQAGDVVDTLEPARAIDPDDPNSARMPWTWQIDIGVDQGFRLFQQEILAWLELRNATDRDNAVRVYNATGEPDDDGWLTSSAGQDAVATEGPGYAQTYRERIENPTFLDDGFSARLGVSFFF